MVDLFDTPEALPIEVHNILDKIDDQLSYEECAKLVSDLEEVGYTCDYYLDANPYNLRKL